MRRRLQTLAAAAAILAAALFIFNGILFPRDSAEIYPWASDNWGHLIKAEYLRAEIDRGNYYPDLFPAWYSGQQMLRYYAPLPYYILVALDSQTENIYVAGSLFIFLTALGGGLSWLLFRNRIGLVTATIGGILFLLVPDNLRVAFAEGNLPRILATALLPLAFYFTLNMLTRGGRRRDFFGLVIAISLIVLSHAMMAAIFILGLGLFAVAHWLMARGSPQISGRTILALLAGLMVSGWWLLPSLTGGITEIDQKAASEAIATFPIDVAFNPALRNSDREIFYVGISLFAIPLLLPFLWKRTEPWLRALVVVSLFMGLISSTLLNDIWKALPYNQLFWPLRFMSFAGFALLLSSLGLTRVTYLAVGARADGAGRFARFGAIGMVAFLLVDFYPSLQLVHTRGQPEEVIAVARELRNLKGWRVATADLSRLGSAPSQLFTTIGGREQVFGWAFQGSITAPLIARINQAMVQGYPAYAVSRFDRLGADDIVVLSLPQIGPQFTAALRQAGYEVVLRTDNLRVFHRDGGPRGSIVDLSILGIGDGSNNLAQMFPNVVVGTSNQIDDYDPEFLDQFDTLFLSRFNFNSRKAAEKIVTDFAASGKRVIVDLTGAPLDALSRLPKFLGVFGEPINGLSRARLVLDGVSTPLVPFSDEFGPWRSVTPQGVDEVLIPFEFPAATGVLLGRNSVGAGEVDFLGLNLVFHALITGDPLAVRLLEAELGEPAFQPPADKTVPLENYAASAKGWAFTTTLEQDEWVLLPMARHAGSVVNIDGQPADVVGIETLALTRIPAGRHNVIIRSEETRVYTLGRIATALGVVIVVAYIFGFIKRPGATLQAPRAAMAPSPEAARA